jgi:hypothetical protein
MKRIGLLLALPWAALPLIAASPSQRGINLQAYESSLTLPVPPVPPTTAPGGFSPAPTPNRDVDGPAAAAASNSPSLSPSLFTRSETYRGDGFNKGSSAQSEQDKHARPGAGFNLRMPLTPN